MISVTAWVIYPPLEACREEPLKTLPPLSKCRANKVAFPLGLSQSAGIKEGEVKM